MSKRLRESIGTVADVAFLVSLGIGAVVAAIVGAYLTLAKAGIGWALLAAVGALLIVSGALRFGWHWLNTRVDPIGEESYLHEKRIRLTDLVVPEDPVVKGRTLDKCRIFGPGLVAFKGCSVRNPRFDGTLDSIFVEVPNGSTVIGPILFEDCDIRDCRFHGIGIVGTPADIAQMKAATVSPSPMAAAPVSNTASPQP